MQRFMIKFGFNQAAGEERFDLRSEEKRIEASLRAGLPTLRVIQRLDADAITDQKERSFFIVPERKRKHSIQARETLFAPFGPRGEQDFGVALRAKAAAFGNQLCVQLAIIVNFAVENHDQPAVLRKHWLMAGAAGVDD